MKNTQSYLFYLLAILFFVKWLRAEEKNDGNNRNYPLTLLCSIGSRVSYVGSVLIVVTTQVLEGCGMN